MPVRTQIIGTSPKRITAFTLIFFALFMAGCERQRLEQESANREASNGGPAIQASPIAGSAGQWKIVDTDYVTLKVTAPGAARARMLYRPTVASDQYVELKSFQAPSNPAKSEFVARIHLPADFAGDVWAEAFYPDGAKRDTEPISLAASGAVSQDEANSAAPAQQRGPRPAAEPTDKSALSDELTGGKIEQAQFQQDQPDIRINVNVPAFQLCFWQNGKLVKTYEIGVGRKDFPIDISNRTIRQIVFNPEWVPPDSPWVEKDPRVAPGEHIAATDRRNPLGKIKIPLGDGYLIHQAEKQADIGHLVSHGCIRMQQRDLIDLAEKIITAESVPLSQDKIQHALDSTDRLAVSLKRSVPISIRYDTLVVQQATLHIYPDIYGRGANTVSNLRSDVAKVGIDTSRIDDATLSQMIDLANKDSEYVVNASDIRSGNELAAGRTQPLTSQNGQPRPRAERTTRHARRPHHR